MMQIEDLHVEFDGENGTCYAVRGVTVSMGQGEILAIVGESGCGKSVLCKSIPGLLPKHGKVSGGKIWWKGRCLTELSERELCRVRGKEIGFVLQNPGASFHPAIPVGKQIGETIRLHEPVSRQAAKTRAVEWLDAMGIAEADKRYQDVPGHFSGGMLQRAAIAMALCCGPQLLIADEPTTALDDAARDRVIELLRKVRRETGVGILFVTHDLMLADRIADRVGVMYAGRIVEIGRTEEVFGTPRHPYTWGLLASMPEAWEQGKPPKGIPGVPPDLRFPPEGDAFAARNAYALEADYREHPPMFPVTDTHWAATWLLDSRAPQVETPVKMVNGKVIFCGKTAFGGPAFTQGVF